MGAKYDVCPRCQIERSYHKGESYPESTQPTDDAPWAVYDAVAGGGVKLRLVTPHYFGEAS